MIVERILSFRNETLRETDLKTDFKHFRMLSTMQARPAASGGSPLSPSIPFCRLASALIRLASTAKPFPTDQALTKTTAKDGFEDAPQQIALTEAAVSVLREGQMIRHVVVEPKTAEPPVRQIEVDECPTISDLKAILS